jgi:lipid-binding SYLF domain-containing protein
VGLVERLVGRAGDLSGHIRRHRRTGPEVLEFGHEVGPPIRRETEENQKMSRNLISAALLALFAILATAPDSHAASAREIDGQVRETLDRFFYKIGGARELTNKSVGILVFPSVVKAGFGVGGEYGEGALLIRGGTVDYYNTLSASVGFQLGVQERSVIIMFMTPQALDQFRRTAGWKVGVDGSVAIITLGAGASIDTNKITSPVVGFILDPKGLMYNLTLEGSKISRISR